jgi:hypothetical protein
LDGAIHGATPVEHPLGGRHMLAVKTYRQDYIDECRSQMEAQLAAYKTLVAAAGRNKASTVRSALESFEALFFNNLTLVLDSYFVNRTRALEGKDGNPLNEVRLLCSSLLSNHGVFCVDKTINYKPETSVLKLRVGNEIRLDEKQFRLLFGAFFSEMQQKFT